MKLAKATEEDLRKTLDFLKAMEMFFDSRTRFSLYDEKSEWEKWDDEDPDKKHLLQIQKDIAYEQDKSPNEVDNSLVIYEFIKEKYLMCDLHWGRVYWAAVALLESCCDPNAGTLEWHPYIDRLLDNSMMGE